MIHLYSRTSLYLLVTSVYHNGLAPISLKEVYRIADVIGEIDQISDL